MPEGVDEVIIVDGQSTDGTVEVARELRPDVRIVIERRPGKGAAIRAGFQAARGDFIVMIDADGSMDPAEIDRCVAALRDRGVGAYERSEHSLRFVTHRHVRPEDVDAVVDAVGVAMADAMSDVAS